jgi:hypothetical protein
LNHRRMVHLVRKDDATGELGSQRRQGCIVGNVARREHERRRLAMKRRKLVLERQMEGSVASNVASTTSTGTIAVESAATNRT